jgi:hypothetical protein
MALGANDQRVDVLLAYCIEGMIPDVLGTGRDQNERLARHVFGTVNLEWSRRPQQIRQSFVAVT